MSTKHLDEAQRPLDQQIADYRAESPEDWADIDRAQAALDRAVKERHAIVDQELAQLLDSGHTSAKVIRRDAVRGLDLAALCDRIHRAAELHPEGPSLEALVEEVGEVARAMQDSSERLAEELLDVAVVALRWHMKEVGR